MRKVKQKEYMDLVKYTLNSGSVLYAEGKPGIGKSQIVHKIAEEENKRVIDIRASLVTEGDLLTRLANEDRTKLIELVADILPREENCVILFDEFRHAHQDIRRMFYQIILDRRLGSHYKLPKNTSIIIISNKSEDVDTEELENALYDRMILRVDVEHDLNEWLEYAYKNNFREEIIAYLNIMKEHFLFYSNDILEMSPRRWEYVNKHWEMRKYVMSDIIYESFENFIKSVMSYKDLMDYLDGTKSIPKDIDEQFKLSMAFLMSNDVKIYDKIINKKTGLCVEADTLTLLGSLRKKTKEYSLVKAYEKLDDEQKSKCTSRLKELTWIYM